MSKHHKKNYKQKTKQLLLLPPPKDEITSLQQAIERDYAILEKDTKIVKGKEEFLSNKEINQLKNKIALAKDKLDSLIRLKENENSTTDTTT